MERQAGLSHLKYLTPEAAAEKLDEHSHDGQAHSHVDLCREKWSSHPF
jgi:hypothetical protein